MQKQYRGSVCVTLLCLVLLAGTQLIAGSTKPVQLDSAGPLEFAPPSPSQFAPRLGVNIHVLRDSHGLDLAHDAGFQFVRMDLLWSRLESATGADARHTTGDLVSSLGSAPSAQPVFGVARDRTQSAPVLRELFQRNGQYRFFPYDALVSALEARGMGVLWILDYGHPDHGGDRPHTNEDLDAFGRYCAAVATHFKGRNVRYEIWNEPNNAQFWRPAPNPAEYALLLREAVAALRRQDPSAQISTGGLARLDMAFLAELLKSNAAKDVNAIGAHPYRPTAPETLLADIHPLRNLVARQLGGAVDVWDTEWGYSSASGRAKSDFADGHSLIARRHQAVLAVRELLTAWALNFPVAVWYDLRDDGPDSRNPEHNYGLLDYNGNEKPAMTAVRTLARAAADRFYRGLLRKLPEGVYGMRLDGPHTTCIVLWTSRLDHPVTVRLPNRNFISAQNIFGDPIRPHNGGKSSAAVQLNENEGPVYLFWNR